jgi:hypothetical protein
MNKPVVYCFSQIKDDLEILLHELHNYFGTNVNYSDFQNSDCLLDSLKMNNSGQESNLFVLDINNSSIETMRL